MTPLPFREVTHYIPGSDSSHLEGGAEAGDLQLAPQLALVAAHAVHHAGDVAELVLKLLPELDGGRLAAGEHGGLVELVGKGPQQRQQLLHGDLQ